MSYPNGTILRRTVPFTDKDKVHLNRVEVTGKSPSNTPSLGEWSGSNGESVVVQPLDVFGPPSSLPVEVGNREYEVEYMPEPTPLVTTTEQVTKPVTRMRAEAPEAVFARQAREAAVTPSPPVVDAAPAPAQAEKPAAKPKPKAKGK
jgi:hypothetical protein